MGLIFVPYRHMHESLLKNSHRGSSESASTEQANTNENSYQSLQDLVRIYDDPSAIDATDRSANLDDDGEGEDDEARPSSSGASTSAASRTEGDSSSGDENARFYRALRRLHTSTPGPSSAANVVSSLIDTRTVRLLEATVVNPGPGLLRTPERSVDDLLQFVRRRTDQSSSASTSSSQTEDDVLTASAGSGPGPGLGLVQFRDGASSGGTVTVNPAFSSSSDSGPTQAYLRHNETRTNVTTHGCLRVIMRRHRGWEEQAARDNFVEYWHYSTIQRREAPGFEVVRDGIARLPWPLLALAGLHTLRSFAYQINSAHHRETPLPDYQGNVFDVVLVSPEPTSNPSEERAI
ncbi:hypothetical protein AXG93_947s1020 [Marchantia polymorpha subsp. ruderalis]|uniref:Uncharacterized protein n=1 Tax=Marchantia polymorpha subsp. ruderalis TaxID=1480154 RepID=A0A176WGB3_MARPO|nr:hypothetical protein AXG93_947s1020 [Marchantia polymorpha subsp. ruderalis]